MAYKQISEQQIQEMKDYGAAGISYSDIAKEMNMSPHTVAKYLGRKQLRVDDNLVERMQKLRDEQGLSNSQIASDLGVNVATVGRYIGKQKTMNRAQWGSLSSHVTGTTFAKEERPAGKLKQTRTSISWEGKDFTYKASTDGKVRITTSTGVAVDLTRDQFLNFIAELSEVGDWLEKNSRKESVMLYHQ